MSDETNKNEIRNVTNKKISEAYKGILRVTPISDVSQQEDITYNEGLYSQSTSDISANIINGILEPGEALAGKSKRYTDNKLPVTDSMGNYLNWNIGTQGLTIGSNIFDSLEYTVLETTETNVEGTSYIANAIMNDVKYQFNNTEDNTKKDIIVGKFKGQDFIVDMDSLDDFITRKLSEYDVQQKEFVQIPSGTVVQLHSSLYNEDGKIEYLVCDGKPYPVSFRFDPKSNTISKGDFFDLFFMIGYTYTDGKTDEDFQNDMLRLLALKEIYKVTKEDPDITPDEIITKLKKTSLPTDYKLNYQVFSKSKLKNCKVYSDGEIYGIEIPDYSDIADDEEIKNFIDALKNNKPFSYALEFQVPNFNTVKSTNFIGSTYKEEIYFDWYAGKNDYIIPHRHFIAVSKGEIVETSDNEYTVIFPSYNENIQYNKDETSILFDDYTTTNEEKGETDLRALVGSLDEHRTLIAEYCDFDINYPSKMDIYNDSYILRDCKSKLISTKSAAAAQLLYLDIDETTETPQPLLYGGFDTLIIKDQSEDINTTDNSLKNHEPNRGMSGEAIFTTPYKDSIKTTLNKNAFNGNVFFSMENVATLPLIKI